MQSGKLKTKHLKDLGGLPGIKNQNPYGIGRASKLGAAWHMIIEPEWNEEGRYLEERPATGIRAKARCQGCPCSGMAWHSVSGKVEEGKPGAGVSDYEGEGNCMGIEGCWQWLQVGKLIK